jgi:hypothetical protein
MNAYTTKISRQAQLQKILYGLGKHFPSVTTLTLGGASYAMTDLTNLIQAELSAITSTSQAKAAYSAQVQVERNATAKVSPLLSLLKDYVFVQLGNTQAASSALEDFGYTPRKSAKKTLATKVEAADKAVATREARHTLGKKQKAEIEGTVPAIAPAATSAPVVKA